MNRPVFQGHALCVIWVVFLFAMLVDRAKRGDTGDAWTWILALTAAFSLMRPSSVPRILVVCSAQAFCYFYGFKGLRQHEHIYVAAIVTVLILAGAALVEFRHRRVPRTRDLFVLLRAPGALIAFTGMFFAGFAKLNSDFLDIDTSCGAIYYEWIRSNPLLAFLPGGDTGSYIGVYGAIAAELGGALLLLPRVTRKLGLLVIWSLSFMLYMNVLSHYFEFVGVFFAMSLFLVDPAVLSRIPRRLIVMRWKAARRFTARVGRRWRVAVFPFLVGAAFGALVLFSARRAGWLLDVYRGLCVGVLLVVTGTVVLDWLRRRAPLPRPRPPHLAAWLLLAVPGLFFVNETTAYIGLAHSPTLTMASNLSLDPVGGNHVIFSNNPAFRIWPDVEIVSSTVPRWRRGVHVPWPRFTEILSARPEAKVTYRVDGGPKVVLERAGDGNFQRARYSRALGLRDYRPYVGARICGKPLPGMSLAETNRLLRQRSAARQTKATAPPKKAPASTNVEPRVMRRQSKELLRVAPHLRIRPEIKDPSGL